MDASDSNVRLSTGRSAMLWVAGAITWGLLLFS
jgi:hypothetical protein